MAQNITTSLNTWNTSNNAVERLTDNIPYTSAHPDDGLVLIGPPRYADIGDMSKLYPVGLLQQFTFNQNRQLAPMQTIGSGRVYFTTGKSTVGWSMQRLFVKGPNLLKALSKNAETQGIKTGNPNAFGERPVSEGAPNFLINLDSELFLVPFGMAVHFRDKSNNTIGGVYLELCMISSYNNGLVAGQSMVMEGVNGMADRLFSIDVQPTDSGFPTGSPVTDSEDSASITKKIFGVVNDGIV